MPDGQGGMDRPALRRFLDGVPFCGCGNPDDAAGALLRVLKLLPFYESHDALAALLPDVGVRFLFLYMLDGHELMEHGGVITGSWITSKGEAVRDALERESADGFEALFADHCVHGYDVTDHDHDCMAADD